MREAANRIELSILTLFVSFALLTLTLSATSHASALYWCRAEAVADHLCITVSAMSARSPFSLLPLSSATADEDLLFPAAAAAVDQQ